MIEVLADHVVELAVGASSGSAALAAREARRVVGKLEKIEDHERALYGDENANWPGLMELVDRTEGKR
jgi:hypothetical protein